MSLVRVILRTGRTHQIRCQFASRNMPLVGERKYSTLEDDCAIALWSHRLRFTHPNGQPMDISALPERRFPWNIMEIPQN